MTDQSLENEIQAKGLTAPRVTSSQIDDLMARIVYCFDVRPNGSTTTLAHAFLDGDFYLSTGMSACVSVQNYDKDIGIKIAQGNAEAAAREKLWELEGYALRKRLVQDASSTDSTRHLRPNPAHGAPKPPGHNPVA